MKIEQLVHQIRKKKSFLCVGLDTDLDRIPKHLLGGEDPIFEFNRAIIEATQAHCVAYKPNLAFYEAHGSKGWRSLERTMDYLNSNYPEQFTIADAKRGDIGNTSNSYAKAFFGDMGFDSLTIAPYMGRDSVEPFLEYEDRHAILLALTSNPGAFDFQTQKLGERELFKEVLATSRTYKGAERLMYVVGATKASFLKEVRELVPDSFLLVPGVGAQGGSLSEVRRYGMNDNVGLLVTSSRGIIYASDTEDFAEKAALGALEIQRKMERELQRHGA